MIHTFEIKQTVNCQKYALDIASRLKFSQKDIQGFRAAIQSGKKGKGIYRSEICKEYKGGGHKKAGGFYARELPKELYDAIFKN